MKVIKPNKLILLHRVVEQARRQHFHVAAMLGFPLATPRALLDELAFWAATGAALGATGVIDEGIAKVRGELLVAGSFHAPGGAPTAASYVRAKVGALDKLLSILGDRFWHDGVPTAPEPVTTMPIDWTRAFGGAGFDRNPYGRGATPIEVGGRMLHPLPNIEPFGALMRAPSERPEPAGLLSLDVTFAQRRARAGTYDDRWLEEHSPGLPPDAEPTFFNVAPEDQWIEGFFRGDEDVLVENMHPDQPRIEGRLPGLVARSFVTHRGAEGDRFVEIAMRCDTVWILPSQALGVVIFHGSIPIVEDDAADVVHLVCACEDPESPRTIDHYRAALSRRLDKDRGAVADLSDSDLMPARSSGVAPNIEVPDIGRWVKSEGLHAANLRRGEQRRREEHRAMLEAEGLNPDEYGLAEPPPEPEAPPVDDPDALAAYMEAQIAKVEDSQRDLKVKAAEAQKQAREAFAEMGEDYDEIIARSAKQGAGPPKPLDEQDLNEVAPDLQAQFRRQHQELIEMYRRLGHLQPTAAPMERESSERARVLVELAIEHGESLAGRDFTGADFSEMCLAGVDLSGAFLEAANLRNADLTGANLEGAVLAKADLRGANLTGARLRAANLGGAVLDGAVLDGADLREGVLSRAKVDGARLAGAQLERVDWLEAKLGAVDLTGAALGACNLLNADLRGARLANADLAGANLVECVLDGADLSGATLTKTTLVGCRGLDVCFRGASFQHGVIVHGSSFPGADFRGADMAHANLRGTALPGARFDGANLNEADLSDCDATGASFEGATAKGALLIRTNLDTATLRGANLMDALASKARVAASDFRDANLYRADFSRVVGDARTTFAGAETGRVRVFPRAHATSRGAS